MEWISEILNGIYTFFYSGIYDFFTEVFAQFVKYSVIASIKFKIFMVGFAWDVTKEIIQSFNLGADVLAFWNVLPPENQAFISMCKIPQAITMVLNAFVTKFVINFMGIK